jgi:hypothetical protein
MFRYKFLLIYCLLFFFSCSPKIATKNVAHRYFNVLFSPEKKQSFVLEKILITIQPIDAKTLNRETFAAAMRDGNYEKEIANTIEKYKLNLSKLSKAERIKIEGRLKAIETIDKLERNNKISSIIAYRLRALVLYEREHGYDGSEIESFTEIENFDDAFNQFKVNNKFLSVFKVTFENQSDVVQKINLKEFQIVTGEEQLYPLANEYFEKNLESQPEKIKNAYRMNMPEELSITSKQKITKYLAVPAINTSNNNLQIQFIRGTSVSNFDFVIEKESKEKEYNLEQYQLIYNGNSKTASYNLYYVVSFSEENSFGLSGNKIFVDKNKKTSSSTIYAIAIKAGTTDIEFAEKENFRFSDQKKNIVEIKPLKIK